jgi:serine/threonine protein kinase
MTADLALRLDAIGAVLADRMPSVLDAAIAILESIRPALDAARSERYEIGAQIGRGGTAEVFLGVARGAYGFHRPVAIKRVRSDVRNPWHFETMLIEEALQASGLVHDNVVAALDFDRDAEGRAYLVMEYVDGVDLATLVEAGPVPHGVAIFIVCELLSGLGYLHEAREQGRSRVGGLVHRDVKPRNVLLSWQGAVKLADFGLAQMVQRTKTVGPHAREGTAGYMSPEQARWEALDGRSDLYAVGVVLWEFLADRRLGAGQLGEITASVLFEAIPRPSEYRQVPADLEAVAMRLLAYDREERYPTAGLAAHDLLRCQDAPRDGRGELVRLLDLRFPRADRQDPLARRSKQGPRSEGPRTVTAPSGPMDAPPAPGPGEPWAGLRRAGLLESAWRWRWVLACGVLLVLALAAAIALLVAW